MPQRDDDLVDARGDGLGGVERNVVLHVRRGSCLDSSCHALLVRRLRDLNGVRAGQLIDGHDPDGAFVVARGQVVDLSAELDAGDVAQMQHRAVRVGADDDIAELLRRDETALRANGVGELLAARRRARRRSGRPG